MKNSVVVIVLPQCSILELLNMIASNYHHLYTNPARAKQVFVMMLQALFSNFMTRNAYQNEET